MRRRYLVLLGMALSCMHAPVWSQNKSDSTVPGSLNSVDGICSGTGLPGIDSLNDSARMVFYKAAANEWKGLATAVHPEKDSGTKTGPQPGLRKGALVTGGLPGNIIPDIQQIQNPLPRKKGQPVKFDGGYLSYNWNYRSAMDVLFDSTGLSQHLVTANAGFTFAEVLPVRVSYFGRETNSSRFKSYRDLRIDLDRQRFTALRTEKELAQFEGYVNSLENPFTEFAVKYTACKLSEWRQVLSNPAVTKKYIESKETTLRKNFADTSVAFKDSVYGEANSFLRFFDSLQSIQKKYAALHDSLQHELQATKATVRRMKALFTKPEHSAKEAEELSALYGKKIPGVGKWQSLLSGIRQFSIGRTFPAFSSLTLRDVNVNGLNMAYSRRKFFFGLAAGAVDFRIWDFLSENQPATGPQYVYLSQVGYGRKESNYIALTGFAGKKQLLNGNLQTVSVKGIAFSTQFLVSRNTRIVGELAQSAHPLVAATGNANKTSFDFQDASQQAYSVGINSYFPATQTKLDGSYQKTGMDYQCFTSYQYNASVNSWWARVEQPLWKRQLLLLAAVRKNDFSNPFRLQRYNANTVFKTATLTFRKQAWPVLSIGLVPVTQNVAIGNLIYENHFQAFTGTFSYQYRLGLAKAFSTLMYSRFQNESSDSGFVFFNAKSVYWNQSFLFDKYTARIGASMMSNNQYNYSVLEGGVNTTILQKCNLDLSVKVNHLQRQVTKFGWKGGSRFALKGIGDLNIWAERSYVPTTQNQLYKYETYNLGLTRFFK